MNLNDLGYNTCFVFGPDGELVGKHRKNHSHGYGGEGWVTNSAVAEPVQVGPVKTGIMVCSDAWYMECPQRLAAQGAQLLVDIVDKGNVPVICYGLRADFQGNLFEGSHWLLAWADSIEEIKTVCWCGKKATCNARLSNGRVIKEGEQVLLGGNESYIALCRKHWAEGKPGPDA